jgi:glycosyltransferase involved in cell wall biosynthesis
MARFAARRAALRFVAKHASCVVAVSTELEQLAHDLGADKRRTIVIGNGVDVDQFAPLDRSIARGRLGCSIPGSMVLCVGHLARVKRFDLVLEALAILRNRNRNVTLAIVGGDGAADRGYGETLKARARALGLKDAVLFPGAVDPCDVSLWMNAADVLVLASEREGSPNVVLEALASGTPVVTSDVGDVRRLINSSNGVLMSSNPTREDVADAIAAVLEHRWDRHRIRETVASQTWRAVGERVVSTWRAAVIGAPEAHGVAAQC